MSLWEDEPTTRTANNDIPHFGDEPDLEQTGMVVQQHRDSSQTAELAQVAQGMGHRDQGLIEREFARIGARLGRELNSQGGSRAVYSWTSKGNLIEGPTIALMNALASSYGRLLAQVHVLEYDPATRRAMLRARVVDLLTLRAEEVDHPCTVAPTPGKFANDPAQQQRWVTMQLRSQGSRAKRNALEQVIPAHLQDVAVQQAKGAHAALVLGDAPFEKVRDKAVATLGEDKRLTRDVLEAWLGIAFDEWRIDDLGVLKVLHNDLRSGRRRVAAVLAAAGERGAPAAAQSSAAAQPDGMDDLGVAPAPTKRKPMTEEEIEADYQRNMDATVKAAYDSIQAKIAAHRRELGDEVFYAGVAHVRANHRTPPDSDDVSTWHNNPADSLRMHLREVMRVGKAIEDAADDADAKRRAELNAEIDALRTKMLTMDSQAWKRAREVSGVKQLQKNTAIKRYELLRDTCVKIIEGLEAGDGLDDAPVVDPRLLNLDEKRAEYLDNVMAMERELGDDAVKEFRKLVATAYQKPNPSPTWAEIEEWGALDDYARRLFGEGWE